MVDSDQVLAVSEGKQEPQFKSWQMREEKSFTRKLSFLKGYLEGFISIDKKGFWKDISKGSLALSTIQMVYVRVTGRVD